MASKVSIIVPCYNAEKYLDDCVASINAQTYKNIEAIFVNDGSTDKTFDKLKELCAGKKNFTALNHDNSGPSVTRNLGLQHAKGEYIVYLDSDDMYAPNYVEVLVNEIEKRNADCVCCQYKKCNEKFHFESIKQKKFSSKEKEFLESENLVCRILAKKDRKLNMVVWNKIYRHSILKQIYNYPNLFDEKTLYSEDIEFIAKYMAHVNKVVVIDDKLIYYRIRKNSLVRSNFSDRKLTAFIGIENVKKFCEEKKYDSAVLETKALACKTAMEMLYRMKVSKVKNKELRRKMLDILDENMKVFKKCKAEPLYMKIFAPLIPGVFKLFF